MKSIDIITDMQKQDSQESWEADVPSPRESSSCNMSCTSRNGERRGSAGAFRPVSIAESRESLHTESTQPKPLREALEFDLTQPWQRSLLRDLEHIENAMLQDEQEQRSRPHADRVLLGHADSGDYMLECEDDVSTATDSSSTCPVRLQLVHRHQFPMRSRFPSREESPDADPAKFMDIRRSPKGIHDEVALTLNKPMPYSESTVQYLAHPKLDHAQQEGFRPIPHALPNGRRLSRHPVSAELYRSNAFSEEARSVQTSRMLVEEEPSVMDYTDPACLCMGYSSLIDLLLFNEKPAARKKKRRTSFWESPPVSRRSSLGRVEEEDDGAVGLNPFCTPSAPLYRGLKKEFELYEEHQHNY